MAESHISDPKTPTQQINQVQTNNQENWDSLPDWSYVGHGQWEPPDEQQQEKQGINLERESEWIQKWRHQ